MTNNNRLQSKCFKLFITLLTILSSFSSLVKSQSDSETFISFEEITTCEKNSPGSTILKLHSNRFGQTSKVEDENIFELKNGSDDQMLIKLKKVIEGDDFSIVIILDPMHKIVVNGTFIKFCDNSSTSSSTVIIAFLASLCLILFTALALTLIILRRKKPITFKFGNKEDKENDRKQFSDNYEENFENSNKNTSIDVTNIMTISRSIDSPRTLQPRKSSLKPPKNSLSDQLNNNNNYTSHENGAFNSTELEVVDEINEVIEDKIEEKIEEKPIQEPRRKSIVTFSEKTEVNYG